VGGRPGYAYVGTFHDPTCDRSGVYISDIRDPANPATVAMVQSPPNTRVNDVKTIQVGERTVLIHSLEPCGATVPSGTKGHGGISLFDVTDPANPHALKQNFLDVPVHNTYPWTDASTGKTYLIVTYDVGARDTAFVDISKPQSPKLLSEVGRPDWEPQISADGQPEMGSFAASFNHDVWVENVGTDDGAEGAFTRPIADLDDQSMNGSTTYVGEACGGSIPAAVEDGSDATEELAVIQRGTCTFQLKAETAKAAGYDGFIVFNDAARGDALVTMGGHGIDIPGIFVGHSTGLAIFDAESAGALTIGQSGADTATTVEFDGWGYFHLLDRESLAETGYYAPGQVNDADYASGFGDLTMHNVVGDVDDGDLAFISWYSLGMRAIRVDTGNSVRPPDDDWDAATPGVNDYYGENVTEVGRFIAEEGSNFWGVYQTTFEVDGEERTFVLGSDRNTGLWIFESDTGE